MSEMNMICDPNNNNSIASIERQAMKMINQHYGCNDNEYCND